MATLTIKELQELITVNIGDYKISKGNRSLITRDLGSCVAVAVRDPQTGVGGLLHIMLPKYVPLGFEAAQGIAFNPAKYADTGLEELVRRLVQTGASRTRLVAKLAGAAHMISSPEVSEDDDISSRNLNAVRKKLVEMNIPVIAEAVGAHHARTVIFEPSSGTLKIITAGRVDRLI